MEERYMYRAIELAKKGIGWVSPNPMVGAVIVKDNRIIGEGYHRRYGGLHAEREALADCRESPKGATIYVTLEPCCHHGKQPPCVDALIEAGIAQVVIGSRDVNPLVAGKGIEKLKKAGITVVEHYLEQECDALNAVFFQYITTKMPYVAMKYAMTMDGKIATYTGASQWITGECARAHVQKLRHQYRGIMVGIGTILADNPRLTCRMENGRNPIRIVCDTHLRTPLASWVVQTATQNENVLEKNPHKAQTIIATAVTDERKYVDYRKAGCEIIQVSAKNGYLDLEELCRKLGEREIDSILLEGGSTMNWSALEGGIVSKVFTYIAPKLFGGKEAATPVSGLGIRTPQDAYKLKNSVITQLENDWLIESEVERDVYRNRGRDRDSREDTESNPFSHTDC